MKRLVCATVMVLLVACRGGDAGRADDLPVDVVLSPDGVQHVQHSFSPDGKRIAYWAPATDSSGQWQLWVANADMSAPSKLAVTSTQTWNPLWTADGLKLAVPSSQFGIANVVAVTLATGGVQRLTQGTGVEIPLKWNAAGDEVAFFGTSAGGTLTSWTVSVSTGTVRPLIPGESRPIFGVPSPDGRHRAYGLQDGSRTTVWVADSVGGGRRQLTNEGFEGGQFDAWWSPTGTELLYESRRTGTTDLWVVAIDGGTPRQLTRNVRNDASGHWSPDGKYIAFISDRGRQTDVWVMSAAGGEERRVTNTVAEEQAPLAWRGPHDLTFGVKDERSGLWTLDVASGTERRLTPDSMRVGDWWLSPDGLQASVIIERGGGARDLAVVPLAGGAIRTLVSGDARIDRPLFSPDGSKIVYSSNLRGSPDIWVVDVVGGAPRQVVNWPGIESVPVWSADGSSILFVSDREARLGDVWKVPASGGEPTRVTRDGGVASLLARSGYAGTLAQRISARNGQLHLLRLREDGTLQAVWDRSSVAGFTLPIKDSLGAVVEQADGSQRSMLLSASGGGGRVILRPGELVGSPAFDGKWLLYTMPVNGVNDLGLFNIANGSVRRLTTTPEDERGAEFTPDGKTVVFSRAKTVQRIHTVDVSRLLTPPSRSR